MTREELEQKFRDSGFSDFKWIDPKKIVVSQWVRMKCMFGCDEFGKTATCPPNVPSIPECERFFRDYSRAVIFHFEKAVERPQDRFTWTRKVNVKLQKLEREVFLSGHEKAFLLFLDSCNLCPKCTGKRDECEKPELARPTSDALGVDVFATVRQVGYPIQVLSDYQQPMNRYAFLLID